MELYDYGKRYHSLATQTVVVDLFVRFATTTKVLTIIGSDDTVRVIVAYGFENILDESNYITYIV